VVWPQGWSFFDGVSEQSEVVVYRVGGENDPSPVTSLQMSARGGWGWGRTAILQVVETQEMVLQIPADAWLICGPGTPTACLLKAAARRFAVTSKVADPTLCGALILSEEMPQSWTEEREPPSWPRSPLRAVGVQVDCERP
jgi:hypothetical protein